MEQISLNFDETPKNIKSPLIRKGVQEWAHRIIEKNSFSFKEELSIGTTHYQLKVSSKIKEWAYTFDEKNRRVTRITFILAHDKDEYRFDIWIASYNIVDWSIEAERYHDETMWDKIGSIYFSAIKKLDRSHGWARFVNRDGRNIQSFDYFRYIFGGTSPHNSLIPIIKNVILSIHEKHAKTEGK
jgi:hypothetical protein